MKHFATRLAILYLTLSAVAACDRTDAAAEAPPSAPEEVAAAVPPLEQEAVEPTEAAPTGPAPTRTTEEGARLFGSELSDRTPIALTTLIETPADYDGEVVKTEGVISAVCQRMGCWMELKADDDSPAIRVPMAGHGFFLPRDVSGARATIEGTVEVGELPPDWQEHLREEGAQAAGQALGINATGVLIHAS
jgi:hypothetical protein